VSGELVDRLDDAELSAALAHEMAHLVNGSAANRHRAALAREREDDSIERAADRVGCSLLASVGLPTDAMLRMLRKVSSGLREPHALAGRIDAASAHCLAPPLGIGADPS
jgi:Zn-dependent protease with chaperone function